MSRIPVLTAIFAATFFFSPPLSSAQQPWPTPPPAQPPPPVAPPAPVAPAPSPPIAELESETTIESGGEGGSTNVNVEVGVRSESAPQRAADPASQGTDDVPEEPQLARFLHGFRLGYLYIHDIESPVDSENPDSQPYADRYGIRSPHMFMLGYELAVRIFGHDWLNMLLIANVLIAGFEQSRFFPSANLMLGFELQQMLQLGVGVSLTPTKDDPAHLVVAAGWTPRVGEFYMPIHFFFVPDINGHHKIGATLGVTF